MAAGDGLSVPDAVRVLVDEGPRYVHELLGWGVRFDRDTEGRLSLAREAAHAVRRVLHATDATGRGLGRALWSRAQGLARLRVFNHARAVALIVEEGRCVGARFVELSGAVPAMHEVRASAVLLATGGAAQVYRDTTNPSIATGDGIRLAWLAGARVADLEFVQFHPTALAVPGQARALLSEALRGEGARLVNHDGEPFMTRYEEAGDLAPRDRVSRGLVREMRRTGRAVYLSLQHLDATAVHDRFPTASAVCRAAGLDLARDPIPVSPAAHYVMGGGDRHLGADDAARPAGGREVACTGIHGANRLASNSLLEGLVFGARAAVAMQELPRAGGLAGPVRDAPPGPRRRRRACPGGRGPSPDVDDVGLLRDRAGLERAVAAIDGFAAAVDAAVGPTGDGGRLASLVTVGRLMARAALRRTESRGGHFRADFPSRDDVHWSAHIVERIRD